MSQHGRAWGSYSVAYVRKLGREHGRSWRWRIPGILREDKNAYPPPGMPYPAPFWKSLQADAETALGVLVREWKEESAPLYETWRQADIANKQAVIDAEKEVEEAQAAGTEAGAADKELAAMGRTTLDKKTAKILLFCLGIGEALFNSIIFQLLGESTSATLIMAVSISILFPWLGHFIGVLLKQEMRRRMDWFLIVASFLTAIAALWAIAYFRGWFLEAGNVQEVLGLQIPMDLARNLFLIINIALLVGALTVSYMAAHGRESEFKSKEHRHQELEQHHQIESAQGAEASALLREAERSLQRAVQALESLYGQYRGRALEIIGANARYAAEYMDSNLAARSDRSPVDCFTAPSGDASFPLAGLPPVFESEDLALDARASAHDPRHAMAPSRRHLSEPAQPKDGAEA